jgi:hypothetical protein
MSGVTFRECEAQSKTVWAQFGESKWKPAAEFNSRLARRDTAELRNVGIGKTLVCAALGASLESAIPALLANRGAYDLMVCDKGFKLLLERGIKADYVHLADTNIETRWMGGDDSPTWAETEGVNLIATPYANPEWTKRWKGPRSFYVNKDAIRSERIFAPMFGKPRIIPASTNVSNAMVVFATGSDENGPLNFFAYERILLTGYDYSWRVGENYYAWNNPEPKRYYMAHRNLLDFAAMPCRTSENLLFSAKWLYTYLTQHAHLPVVNCSERGLLDVPRRGSLATELSKHVPTPEQLRGIREAFGAAQLAHDAYEAAKREFTKKREAVYAWS